MKILPTLLMLLSSILGLTAGDLLVSGGTSIAGSVKIKNTGTAEIVVSPITFRLDGTAPSGHFAYYQGTDDNTIPVGATRDFAIRVDITDLPWSGSVSISGTIPVRATDGTNTHDYNLPIASRSWNLSYGGGANYFYSEGPPLNSPEFEIALSPEATGRITVIADGLAAGARQWSYSGEGSPPPKHDIYITEGSNVILDTDEPDLYSGTVNIYQAGFVIGSGTITKDGGGSFDLSINATGATVQARIRVRGGGLDGPGRLSVQGWPANTFVFVPATLDSYERTWDDPDDVASGAIIKVEHLAAGVWKEVGKSAVIKDGLGGFDIVVDCASADSGGGSADAVFTLDVLDYDPGTHAVTLKINGETHVATPSASVGNKASGRRTTFTVRLNNSAGAYNGKAFSWNISGNIGGSSVNQALTGGTTPVWSGQMLDTDPPTPAYGFVTTSGGQIGEPGVPGETPPEDQPPGEEPPPTTPGNPDPPPAEYDPRAPLPPVGDPGREGAIERKNDYETMRKAIEDAMDEKTPFPENINSLTTEQADDVANKVTEARESMLGMLVEFKQTVGTWQTTTETPGQSPYMTWHLPILGTVQFDAGILGGWPSIFRQAISTLVYFLTGIKSIKLIMTSLHW